MQTFQHESEGNKQRVLDNSLSKGCWNAFGCVISVGSSLFGYLFINFESYLDCNQLFQLTREGHDSVPLSFEMGSFFEILQVKI